MRLKKKTFMIMYQEIGNISQLDNKIKSLQSKKNKKNQLDNKNLFYKSKKIYCKPAR